MRRTLSGAALLFLLAPKLLALGSYRDRLFWDPGSLNPWHYFAGFALAFGSFVVTQTAVNRARLEDVQPSIGHLLLLRATCLVHGTLLASVGMLLTSVSGLLGIGFLVICHALCDWREKVNSRRKRTVLRKDSQLSERARKLSGIFTGVEVHRFDVAGDLRPLAEAGRVILTTSMLGRLSKREIDAIAARQLNFAGVSRIGSFLCGTAYTFTAIIARDHFAVTSAILLAIHAICLTAVIGQRSRSADLEAVRQTKDPQALLSAITKLHDARSWATARRLSRIAKMPGTGIESAGTGAEIEHYSFPLDADSLGASPRAAGKK